MKNLKVLLIVISVLSGAILINGGCSTVEKGYANDVIKRPFKEVRPELSEQQKETKPGKDIETAKKVEPGIFSKLSQQKKEAAAKEKAKEATPAKKESPKIAKVSEYVTQEQFKKLEKKVAVIDNKLGQLTGAVHDLSLRTMQYEGNLVPYYFGPFKRGSADIEEFKPGMRIVAELIKKGEVALAKGEGFSSVRGAEAKNLKLSQARIDNAMKFLESCGVDIEGVPAKGRGEIRELGICEDNRAIIFWCQKQ